MANPTADHLEFENLHHLTNVRLSKVITTSKGLKYRAVAMKKNHLTLIPEDPDGFAVVMTGPGVAEASVGGVINSILGGLGDAINAAIDVVKKLGCTPQTTVQQTFDQNGHLVGQTITTTCVPN
jgi:hypothetical protein